MKGKTETLVLSCIAKFDCCINTCTCTYYYNIIDIANSASAGHSYFAAFKL